MNKSITRAMNKDNTVNIELLSRVDNDKVSLNATSLFDFLLIAIMLITLSSKFIISSGASIALNAKDCNLPVSINSQAAGLLTTQELTVLHVHSDNMILFDGNIYNMKNFELALKDRQDLDQQVLLIKINKDCDIQSFLNICELAQNAGFKAIQIASQRAN